jgi:hypothetical protein
MTEQTSGILQNDKISGLIMSPLKMLPANTLRRNIILMRKILPIVTFVF